MRDRGRILVRGIVQGVGFRPFVYARAHALGIRGTVKNTGSQVEIDAWGDRFGDFLEEVSRGPPLARIDSVDVLSLQGSPPTGFLILISSAGTLSGMIPPDVSTCGECVEDLFDEDSRYRGYFATSCVNCGPRYSIIESLPYDRERTSMASFPMCPECGREYTDPACRRHHAQTIACPVCGPRLTLMDSDGRSMETADPVREAASLLDAGSILAAPTPRRDASLRILALNPQHRAAMSHAISLPRRRMWGLHLRPTSTFPTTSFLFSTESLSAWLENSRKTTCSSRTIVYL
jgi:hydrogenase maturation protein HypF